MHLTACPPTRMAPLALPQGLYFVRHTHAELALLLAGIYGEVARLLGKVHYEAFRAAAGGWKDIDTDKLVANISATRKRSNRPPVTL